MIWEIEFLFNVDGKREKLMHADGGLIQSQWLSPTHYQPLPPIQ
jgi:hypothetical protein